MEPKDVLGLAAALAGPVSVIAGYWWSRRKVDSEADKVSAEGEVTLSDAVLRWAEKLQAQNTLNEKRIEMLNTKIDEMIVAEANYRQRMWQLEREVSNLQNDLAIWQRWAEALVNQLKAAGLKPLDKKDLWKEG